jgi:hypothetical protein
MFIVTTCEREYIYHYNFREIVSTTTTFEREHAPITTFEREYVYHCNF